MSHKATNWAVTVRGVDATCKLVLWHLADRHNKETGRCDPSQELLSQDCEISRATLNRKLQILEDAGLIERQKRLKSDTKRQETTFYKLCFERDRPQDMPARVSDCDTEAVSQIETDPCLKSDESRVSDCDTNLGREPGREPCAAKSAAQKDFEVFFEVFPRAVKEEVTRVAYDEALACGVSPAWLLSSAKAYAAENKGNKTSHVKMSDTWLKESRWRDYPFKAIADVKSQRETLANSLRSRVPAVRAEAEAKWRRLFPDEPMPMEAAE